MTRRRPHLRPARPDPVCESCGADVWWAWGVAGKVWTPLVPVRAPWDGVGTYEVWRDAHGGLLCRFLEPGARGDQDNSWRGAHHNVACGTWRLEATTALAREAELAVPAMRDGELLALGTKLRRVEELISGELRRRVLEHDDEDA